LLRKRASYIVELCREKDYGMICENLKGLRDSVSPADPDDPNDRSQDSG